MKRMRGKEGKLIFIVNPLSSKGKALKIILKIEQYLEQTSLEYEIHYTEYAGHAIKLAKKISGYSNIKTLIAVGGDGTINEVINGLYPSTIPLGLIPAGSGNDYAKHMGIPTNPIHALKRILNGITHRIDIGKINQRLFINVAGIGFDAEITTIANQSPYKKYFGKAIYIYGFIKGIFTYKPNKLKIIMDDNTYLFEKVWFVSIANNKYFGGGMLISPKADNQDGILDICIIKDLSILRLILLFPTIFSGNHLRYKDNVVMLRGKRAKIEVDDNIPGQADGELLNEVNVMVEVIHKGLYVTY